MDTTSIKIPESLKQFVDSQLLAGGYSSFSEYVTNLISEDQMRKYRQEIDQKLLEALESGPATPFDSSDIEEIISEIQEQSRLRK